MQSQHNYQLAIEEYLRGWPSGNAVPITSAVRNMRVRMPDMQITNRELEEALAKKALADGLAIYLDLNAENWWVH